MRELKFLINDVREATDNTDVNGVKDKEIIRYFNDAIRSIQALVFKNNPLCSYFQTSMACARPIKGLTFTLPTDTYGDNAVSFVEINADGGNVDSYAPLERCWPEDQNNFFGWYTRNRSIVFTGKQDTGGYAARVWYFQRLPRWDKKWATVGGIPVGQVITIAVLDEDFSGVDNFISIYSATGELKLAGVPFVVTSPTSITVVGNVSTVGGTDYIVMGKNSTLAVDLPEEVETYLLDYVSKRVSNRNNYSDANKLDWFTAETKADIISIFNDVGQAQVRGPITDTDYMRL